MAAQTRKTASMPNTAVPVGFDALRDVASETPSDPRRTGRSTAVREARRRAEEMRALVHRSAADRLPSGDRWLAFESLGTGPATVVPRLLLLWLVGLPLVLVRMTVAAALIFLSMGVPSMLVVGVTTGGAVVFQATYRDVMDWAMHDDDFQFVWDAAATVLGVGLSILVYSLRLIVEIWNGFCPIVALFVDVLYELAVQLTVVWYAAPVLQYMALWVMRLVVCLTEPALDLLVAVAESFMFLVNELLALVPPQAVDPLTGAVDPLTGGPEAIRAQAATAMGMSLPEYDTYCAEHPEDEKCHVAGGAGRRLFAGLAYDPDNPIGRDAADAIRPVGDILLEVVCVVLTVLLRVSQALLVALAPLAYAFLRLVFVTLVKLAPVLVELVATVASILNSEATRRILDFLLQALPLLLEVAGGLLCSLGVYLGSAICYVIYALSVTLGFVLRYLMRPVACGGLAVLSGCFEAFVMSAIEGKECYSCGQYNTACGCRRNTFPVAGCGGTCVDVTDPAHPLVVVAPPPTASPPVAPLGNRSRSYGETDEATQLNQIVNSPGTYADEGDPLARDAGAGDPDFPLNSLPSQTTPGEASPFTDDGVFVTRSNRTTEAPTVVVLGRLSRADVFATPSRYADVATVQVPESDLVAYNESVVVTLGTLPRYDPRTQNGTVACVGGVDSGACDADTAHLALGSAAGGGGAAAVLEQRQVAGGGWAPVDVASRRDSQRVAPYFRVEFARPGRALSALLEWGSNEAALQAPAATRYVLRSDGGREAQVLREYGCLPGQLERLDRVVFSPDEVPGNATELEIRPETPCPGALSPRNFGALYDLRSAEIAVSVPPTAAVGTTVRTTVTSPQLTQGPDALRVRPACGRDDLEGLVDERRGSLGAPVVFSLAQGRNASGEAVLVFRVPDSVVVPRSLAVHLRGPGELPPDAVACAYLSTDTSDPPISTDPRCVAVRPLWENSDPSHGQEYRLARALDWEAELATDARDTSPQDQTAGAARWQLQGGLFTDRYETEHAPLPLFRDASYAFRFGPGVGPVDRVALRFSPGDLRTRAVSWRTVLAELGLDPERAPSAQWSRDPRLDIRCALPTDDPPTLPSRYLDPGRHTLGADAFGGETRRWLALDEIVLRSTAAAPTAKTANRRLLRSDTEDVASVRAALESRLLSEDANWSQGRTRRAAVSAVLDKVDPRLRPFAPPDAPEDNSASPFYEDLSQMPDPTHERVFRCSEDPATRCHVLEHQRLPGTHRRTESSSLDPDTRGVVGVENYTRAVLAELGEAEALVEARRAEVRLRALASQERLAAMRRQPRALEGVRTGRRLMGSRVPSFPDVWDGIKDKVKDVASAAASAAVGGLERALCAAMNCGAYCRAEDGCDSSSVADCFVGFGQFLLESAFGCERGENVLECVTRPIRDMFKWLLRQLLRLVDLVGTQVGRITGMGEMLKSVACIGCSVTGVVSGVLADFVEDFPVSTCSEIVDRGTEQCDAWDMGADDIGANVFGNVFPAFKLAFGLVQVLPATVEMLTEVASVVFSGLLDLFPELMGESVDVLLFFISASEAMAVVDILFEAFDPLGDDGDGNGLGARMAEAVSRPAPPSPSPPPQVVERTCSRPGEASPEPGGCGARYRNGTRPDDRVVDVAGDQLGFRLDSGCGCGVQMPSCADGPGVGACPRREGSFVERQRARAQRAAAARNDSRTLDPDTGCAHWPYCDEVQPRVVGERLGDRTDSGELQDVCVRSRGCRVRAVTPGGRNHVEARTLPFVCFSRRPDPVTDDSVFWRNTDECPSAPNFAEDLGREAVHRRRASRRLMGMAGVFEDPDPDLRRYLHPWDDLGEADLARAWRGADAAIRAGNRSYAALQVAGIRNEARSLVDFHTKSFERLSGVVRGLAASERFAQVTEYTRRVVGRHLLFGISGVQPEKIGCGWAAASDYAPNTYPCCRGIWCCVPPPFPDDFRPTKAWFEWQDQWHHDAACPYLRTYTDCWLFALRAVCKLAREAADGAVGVWPYHGLVDVVWSVFEFPDDEWPDTANNMWRCLGLNSGAYILGLLLLVVVARVGGVLSSFLAANVVILTSTRGTNRAPRRRGRA